MVKCNFCGIIMPAGTGKLLARNNGDLYYFCSNKCEKNQIKLKRLPRNIKWTEEARKAKGKA